MLKDFFKALREEGKRKKQTIEVSKAKKSADSITHLIFFGRTGYPKPYTP